MSTTNQLIRSRTMLLALTLVLSGCVSIPKQTYDKTNTDIRKIALLKVVSPPDYSVSYEAGGAAAAAGVFGGAIGGLIVGSIIAADMSKKSSAFTEQVKSRDISLTAEMAATLERELRTRNYDVVHLADQRPGLKDSENGKEEDYSAIQTDADAMLFVWMPAVGYRSTASSEEKYLPWIRVNAKLVARKDQKPLYIQWINYGPGAAQREEIHHISADMKYAYADFDTLMGNTDEALQGLRMGIAPIAARIASDLR